MSSIENYQGFYSKDTLPFLQGLLSEVALVEEAKLKSEVAKLVEQIVVLQQAYIGDAKAPSRRCAAECEFVNIFMEAIVPIYDKLTENLPVFKRRGGE